MNNIKIIISSIIGCCFVLGSIALGISFYHTKAPVKTVSVVGLAQKDFTSDLIVLEFEYKTKNMNLKTAYDSLKNQTKIVKEFIQSQGIADNSVNFKAVNNSEDLRYEYDHESGHSFMKFQGYILTQKVRIESTEIEKIEEFHRNIVGLLDKGITIETFEPYYYYTQLADLKIEMLAEASKDARHRAETITKNAGAKLGKLKVANMGVFQITAPNSNDEDYTWGGAFNINSKEKRATINMRLTYYVK